MIKYLGSKRLLIPWINRALASLPNIRSAIDLFSGTSRVGHAMKAESIHVTANDVNAYAHTLATCYVQCDRERWFADATRLITELQATPPRPGYLTQTYCERSRFIHPHNGAKIDAIRQRISELALDPELEAIALVSLMEAADRVDSTAGVQMAYLKSWAPRAHNELELRVPRLLPGKGRALCGDAIINSARVSADLAYLDPPYNQHAYLGNYHLWETLVRWDAPEVYGIACKRVDCKTRKSPFNSRRKIEDAMTKVVRSLDVDHLLVSFSNEGYLDRDRLIDILSERGPVSVMEIPYERYVGAKIGIYNPGGQKVGRVSHTRNIEYLFHVGPRCRVRPLGFTGAQQLQLTDQIREEDASSPATPVEHESPSAPTPTGPTSPTRPSDQVKDSDSRDGSESPRLRGADRWPTR